ncbi:hypothetical protein SIL08_21510 [Scandinavium sp. V105_16]|uniref:Uncharacterized protein n=1 Tax=Scandinavium lactucae TaxID=3095028 RepID=A0AAJ2VVP4_9ENTR|nr:MULTISPECIES: hypothetical protein [unclassified Scandinavium]MDX6022860.1 hypothetical protein [Scandinavium sp. V105_16]MDX6033298.1 hypothetical protein [Scandinavium sp. V105_12]
MFFDKFLSFIFSAEYCAGVMSVVFIAFVIYFSFRFDKFHLIVRKVFYCFCNGVRDASVELGIIFSSSKNTHEKTLKKISEAANNFQFRLQKIIFLALMLVLFSKGFFEMLQTLGIFTQNPYELRSTHSYVYYFLEIKTLVYVASALAISCGIQLAYMLITDGPDEAVDPLMLGIASTILLILSDSNAKDWTSDRSFAVVMLVICLPILFACSRWMQSVSDKGKKEKKDNPNQTGKDI